VTTVNHNIIIIEDNETYSLLVTHYLKNNLENAVVFAENSGARAMESIKRLKPSLVILDYYLEDGLSAKDVMEVINEMDAPRPRVILLSSLQDADEIETVMKMGIERFVPKANQGFYELVRTIEELLYDGQTPNNDSLIAGNKGLPKWVLVSVFLIAILLVLLLTRLLS
jgi:DNA-binding NarL/FixJ family response regulator